MGATDIAEVLQFFYNIEGISGEKCKICEKTINVILTDSYTWECPNCKFHNRAVTSYHEAQSIGKRKAKGLKIISTERFLPLHDNPDFGDTKEEILEGIKLARERNVEI